MNTHHQENADSAQAVTTRNDENMSHLIDAYANHLAAYCTPTTVRFRRYTLRTLHNALPYGIAWAATTDLEKWLARKSVAPRTRATYGTIIRSFYHWATRSGWLDGDPALLMARQRRGRLPNPDPIEDHELAKLLDHPNPHWRLVCLLAAYAGLRRAEICASRREHIDPVWLQVPHGKGGQPGMVPTHPLVWATVQHLPPGLLVTGPRGRALSPPQLGETAREHFNELGLPGVHLHRLRHWYGTTIQQRHGDIRVTQECLRHKDVGSTQGYTAVADRQRIAAVVGLPVPTQRRPVGVPADL